MDAPADVVTRLDAGAGCALKSVMQGGIGSLYMRACGGSSMNACS